MHAAEAEGEPVSTSCTHRGDALFKPASTLHLGEYLGEYLGPLRDEREYRDADGARHVHAVYLDYTS